MAKQSLNGVLQHLRKMAAAQTNRELADRDLLERFVGAHDDAAFTVLIERHGPMVLGVCRRALPNFHDAEDACQATFLVLARKAASVRQKTSLSSWLHGVACRVALSLKRDHARRKSREHAVDAPAPKDPAAEVTWREVQTILDEELEQLPERYRAPVILCYLECLTREDAAKQLALSPGSLHGRLERGRDLLRERLSKRGLTFSAVLSAAALGESVAQAALAPTFVVSSTKAALLLAAGKSLTESVVATHVLALTQEVLKIMFLTQLKLGAAALLCAGLCAALIGGSLTSLSVAQDAQPRPLFAPQLVSTDEPARRTIEEPKTYDEARTLAANTPGFKNLQRIGLAFHGYHDIFGKLPPAVLFGPDGKTPYSWRVELLPVLKHYVDEIEPNKLRETPTREQYNKLIASCGYDISQPWDSPRNRPVLEAIPQVYRHPSDARDSVTPAYYAVVGAGTAFDPKKESRYTDIKGWPATTLMIVESRSREPWTKPIDIGYSRSSTVPLFGGFTKNGFLALSCDGAVHFVSDTVSPENLRAFIDKENNGKFTIMGIPHK